jgi:hypothetical protein
MHDYRRSLAPLSLILAAIFVICLATARVMPVLPAPVHEALAQHFVFTPDAERRPTARQVPIRGAADMRTESAGGA